MVITALTRNQVYWQQYRGFESLSLRQKRVTGNRLSLFFRERCIIRSPPNAKRSDQALRRQNKRFALTLAQCGVRKSPSQVFVSFKFVRIFLHKTLEIVLKI